MMLVIACSILYVCVLYVLDCLFVSNIEVRACGPVVAFPAVGNGARELTVAVR